MIFRIHNLLRTFTISAMVLSAATSAIAEALPIVFANRGAPPSHSIVVRADATACERYAAEELRDFLKRQTGVTLPIASDDAELPPRAILIGATRHSKKFLGESASVDELGDEGFRIKSAPPHLLIFGGGGRGPLYGVYELLERFGGCAWYSLRFQVVPELQSFSVPGDFDETQRPAFELRSENWNGFGKAHEFAARNKLNLEGFGERLGGSRFRFDPVLGSCHTFEKLMPAGQWFDSHPEYFSLVNGVRVKNRTQLCLTNPDVLRICTEEVLKRIAVSYPGGIRKYGVSPNDWMNACECENCMAVDRAAKSRAGTLIAFVNKIAEVVESFYPDVQIQTLAYSYTRRPPIGIMPRHNVQVCICTIECDFSKPIPYSRSVENRRVFHDFGIWKKSGCSLSVWDYASDFGCHNHIWPNYGALRGNLNFFRKQGVKEVFTLVSGGGHNDVWSNIRCWLLAKWMWNPDLDEKVLLDRCFRDYFGSAAKDVRAYFNLICQTPRDTKRFPLRCFANVYAPGTDDAMLEKCAQLLKNAALCAKGTPHEENVRLARIPLDFTRVMRGAGRPNLSGKPVDLERWNDDRDAAKRLTDVMDSPGGMSICDDLAGRTAFEARIRALASQTHPDPVGERRLVLDEMHFTGSYPVTQFRYVDDPLARNRKAVLLPGESVGCTAFLDLQSLNLDANRMYALRVRLRTGSFRKGDLPFRAGVYNLTYHRAVLYYEPDDVDLKHGTDSYRWYSLGVVTPVPGDALWIGLGGGDNPNLPAPDIWIDRVEVVLMD